MIRSGNPATSTSIGFCIGITGIMGSGKSTVAREYEKMGYRVLYSDAVARSFLSTHPLIRRRIVSRFGNDIIAKDGTLDRERLSAKVFANRENLTAMNAIVHPAVISWIDTETQRAYKAGHSMVFVESALIFEARIASKFDYIITVTSPLENILKRISRTASYTQKEVRRRIALQLSQEEKATRADFVIENSGAITDLRSRALFILSLLKALCKR